VLLDPSSTHVAGFDVLVVVGRVPFDLTVVGGELKGYAAAEMSMRRRKVLPEAAVVAEPLVHPPPLPLVVVSFSTAAPIKIAAALPA
jgi:hypothetical protein